jgi:hypothetical protein
MMPDTLAWAITFIMSSTSWMTSKRKLFFFSKRAPAIPTCETAIRNSGTEDGNARFVGGRQDAIFRSDLREFASEQVEKLAG